ncbi:hypothetical protein LguiA_008270 [Lonicera macranthoides]
MPSIVNKSPLFEWNLVKPLPRFFPFIRFKFIVLFDPVHIVFEFRQLVSSSSLPH